MPSVVVKVLVNGGWGGWVFGIIRARVPVGSPWVGQAPMVSSRHLLEPYPRADAEIRSSTCRNRSNERDAVISVEAYRDRLVDLEGHR